MTNQQECGRCVWQDLGTGAILQDVVGDCVYRSEGEDGVSLCSHSAAKAARLLRCPHPAIMTNIHNGVAETAQQKKAGHRQNK